MTRSCAPIVVFLALLSSFPRAATAAAGPSKLGRSVIVADEPKADTVSTSVSGKSAGTIDGAVTAIDYRSNTMSVVAGSRKVDVTILPSTNIQGPNNGFRTIADIQRGSHVRVLLSQRAGLYTAQIITLR